MIYGLGFRIEGFGSRVNGSTTGCCPLLRDGRRMSRRAVGMVRVEATDAPLADSRPPHVEAHALRRLTNPEGWNQYLCWKRRRMRENDRCSSAVPSTAASRTVAASTPAAGRGVGTRWCVRVAGRGWEC